MLTNATTDNSRPTNYRTTSCHTYHNYMSSSLKNVYPLITRVILTVYACKHIQITQHIHRSAFAAATKQ